MLPRLPMLLLPVLIAGCKQDTTISDLRPRIAVAPGSLDFGDQVVPIPRSEPVFITNNGAAPLELDLAIVGDGFELLVDAQDVPRGQTSTLEVVFAPPSFLPYDGELVITSNDPDTPEVRVPLAGVGVSGPVPDIQVEPLTLDLGDVAVGSSTTSFLLLENVGDAALTLGSLGQAGSGAFSLQTDPSYNVVGPRSEVPVLITYAPFNDAGDSGSITIPSDDPDEPLVTVVLLGNGGGDFEYPIAAIDCPGTSAPPTWVTLSGAGSSDPLGQLPLTYDWSLVERPNGSQEDLTNLTTDTTRLFTDVAGLYDVELVVTNALGTRSAPARCAIDAVPLDAVHVELLWDTASADLDLHLARDGAAIFTLVDDCNFCNTSPAWGSAGADDDPRLDLDDQGGFGPENINIRAPVDGTYDVRVHYYEENGDDAVNATVRVYTQGTLAWEGQRAMFGNEVWDVGVVNWPAGTFGVSGQPSYPSPARSCAP